MYVLHRSGLRPRPLHFFENGFFNPLRGCKQRKLVKQIIDICFAAAFHPLRIFRPLIAV